MKRCKTKGCRAEATHRHGRERRCQDHLRHCDECLLAEALEEAATRWSQHSDAYLVGAEEGAFHGYRDEDPPL